MANKKSKTVQQNTFVPEERQKLLPPPREMMPEGNIRTIYRLISALILAIVGFNFARSDFFYTYPLFGVDYLAQLLITPLAALAGYFVLFEGLIQVRRWFERLIVNTVVEVVSNFWDLQSKRIQEQRRIKQKVRSDLEEEKREQALKNAVAVDTSVLIDGRVLEIVKLGFLDNNVIVLQEVIDELHLLSDSKDTMKRQKGRRGLDILRDLRKFTRMHIEPADREKNGHGVDNILLKFCTENGVKLATLDFNLAKVANVAGVKVLNINALSNSIKTVMLPGEEVTVKIIHEGKEKQQGVGYLEDGTMLVVENAKDRVGEEVPATVAKVIQSQAGKMIFCKLKV
jgi:uncharacterized protein YacL